MSTRPLRCRCSRRSRLHGRFGCSTSACRTMLVATSRRHRRRPVSGTTLSVVCREPRGRVPRRGRRRRPVGCNRAGRVRRHGRRRALRRRPNRQRFATHVRTVDLDASAARRFGARRRGGGTRLGHVLLRPEGRRAVCRPGAVPRRRAHQASTDSGRRNGRSTGATRAAAVSQFSGRSCRLRFSTCLNVEIGRSPTSTATRPGVVPQR